jgi:hypothetical protein
MSKWTGVVVAALSSLMMAACGPVDGTESPETALGQDEAALYVCGDAFCNRGEPSTCPEDCTYGTWCGDGYCGGPENSSNCYQDCQGGGGGCLAAPGEQREPAAGLYVCGDYFCNKGEPSTCPSDCTYGTWCGDGYCGGPENSSNCYQDCRC